MKQRNLPPALSHVFEELEPRIMYSADFAPGLADDAGWTPHAEVRSLDQGMAESHSANIAQHQHEILFVDARVEHYEQLIDAFAYSRPAGNVIEVVVLDAERDGIEQLTQELSQRNELAAVHVISHGSAAALQLGSTSLGEALLPRYAEALQRWSETLTADGDILLYGCEAGANGSGEALVRQLALVTGADVAASVDLTGSRELGGDWDLELRTGAIEATVLGYGDVEIAWHGVLATFTVTNSNDAGAGSLRQAILDANANGDTVTDSIVFSIGSGAQTITPLSALPSIDTPVFLDATTQPGFDTNLHVPIIRLEGNGLNSDALTIGFSGKGSTVQGLMISGFDGDGVEILGRDAKLYGNYIGTDGSNDLGNAGYGVNGDANANVAIVGGTGAGQRNVISGNGLAGLHLRINNSTVVGNYIGVNAAGTAVIANDGGAIVGGGNNTLVSDNLIFGGVNITGNGATYASNTIVGGLFVTTTADNADGDTSSIAALIANKGADLQISLREAIEAANNTANFGAAPDVIGFDIAGVGVQTITITYDGADFDAAPDALPTIAQAVVIDGTSQPGFVGTPLIRLDGANQNMDGLTLGAGSDGSTIQGFMITRFGSANPFEVEGDGIAVQSDNNTIIGNYLGTDGTNDLGNRFTGINVTGSNNRVGGTNVAARNVISGNNFTGVTIQGAGATGNQVLGNYIGTNAAGASALGNGFTLVTPIGAGVLIDGGATGNTVGGPSASERNVISGNVDDGVEISDSSNNRIYGNWIGLNAAGTAVVGNDDAGVYLENASGNFIGGASAGEANVVGGNKFGIALSGTNATTNLIQGNLIGTDAGRVTNFGNTTNAILFQSGLEFTAGAASNNTIGGVNAGEGNVIAFSGNAGILVADGTGNTLRGNSTFSNTGLGLDLSGADTTANDAGDADTGANNLQNFPALTSANMSGGQITLGGTLNTNANATGVIIDFYVTNAAQLSGAGDREGAGYLGSATVNTDASGNATFSNITFTASLASGELITATATTPGTNGNTSEFSAGLAANTAPNGTSSALSVNEDASRTFAAADFGFNDADAGDLLSAVRIDTLSLAPGSSLKLSGADVMAGQVIAAANIANLVFAPAPNANGSGYASLTFSVRDATSAFDVTPNLLTINVTPANDAPLLDSGKSPTLNPLQQNAGTPVGAVGTLVSQLVDFATPAGQVDNISDADAAAQLGIAVTGVDAANGALWYSIDNGANWSVLGAVSNSNALLLAADGGTRVYFRPHGGVSGTLSNAITFSAWDQTSGANGASANTTANGGATAFSSSTDSASLTVLPSIAPTLTLPGAALSYAENDAAAVIDAGAIVSDVDSTDFDGGALTVDFSANGSADDRLSIRNQGSAAGQIGVSGSTITYGGIAIGTSIGGTNGAIPIVVTLNANATPSALQALVRNVTFHNVSEAPSAAARTVRFVLDDGHGGTSIAETETINVTAIDDAPTSGGIADISVNEDAPASVIDLWAAFADIDDADSALTFSVVANTNPSLLASTPVNNTSGKLTLNYVPDGAGTASITVRATDSGGAFGETAFAVTVNPSNDAPVLTTNVGLGVNEGATGTVANALLRVGDVDNSQAQLVYTLTALPGNGSVRLGGATLALGGSFTQADIDAGLLTYQHDGSETSSDAFTFSVSDGAGGAIAATAFSIGVSPVNDNNPVITSNGGGVSAALSVGENTAAVTGVTATDADLPAQQLIYSIVGGADVARFTIDADSGALSFATAPDFESPSDSDTNNVYEVLVQVSDGSRVDSQAISVAVTNVNEGGIGPTADNDASADNVSENAAIGGTVGIAARASDPDSSDSITYTLDDNASGRFAIDSVTGAVTVAGALDHESATSHSIVIRAASSDGSSTTRSFTINLIDQNDNAPVIGAGQVFSIGENTANGSGVGTVAASDADSASVVQSWTIVGGTGASAFAIDAASGTISVADARQLDFESSPSFTLLLTASDGASTSAARSVTISLSNVNEAPDDLSLSGGTVAENSANATSIGSVSASDADAGESFTYSLLDDAGGRFVIDSNTGLIALSNGTLLDFEGSASHNLTVRVSDAGGLSYDESFTINVANVNEVPLNNVPGAQTVNEDTPLVFAGANAISVSDVEANLASVQLSVTNGTLSVNLAGGATLSAGANGSNSLTLVGTHAQINAALGSMSYQAVLNFNGTDTLGLVSTDTGGLSASANVALSVNAANDAPNPGRVADVTASEDASPSVIDVWAAFADVDHADSALTFSIAANDNAALFASAAIDNAAGTLTLAYAAHQHGVANITLRATDGAGSFADMTFTVTVVAVNDAPALTVNTLTVDEGGVVTLSSAQINSADVDDAAPLLRYTVSEVSGGRFEFTSNPGAAVQSFTQDDIDAQRVRFVHDGGELAPSYQLSVSDGSAVDGPSTVAVNFANINDAPLLSAANGVPLGQSNSLTLSDALLAASDADHAATQLVYTIVEAPRAGQLELSTNPGVAVWQFTQADIDAELLRYVGNDGALNDSFSLVVSDGSSSSTAATFLIQRGAPSLAPIVGPSQRTPSVTTQLDPLTVAAETIVAPATTASERTSPGQPSAASVEATLAALAERDTTPSPGEGGLRTSNANSTPERPVVQVANADAITRRTGDARPAAMIKPAPVVLAEALQAPAAIPAETDSARALDAQAELADGRYFEQLNQVRDQIQQQFDIDQSVLGSSFALSTGLSVGYVIWVARAGVLASSLLSALPAWGAFDPLPVLGKLKDDDEEQDESLQDIVRRVRGGAPGTAPRQPAGSGGALPAPELTGPRFLQAWSTGEK